VPPTEAAYVLWASCFSIRSMASAAKVQSQARSSSDFLVSSVVAWSAHLAHSRANCRYSRDVVTAVTSPPNFPRPVQLNLHDGPVCSERNTVIGIGISGDGLHTLELCTPVVVINVRAPSVRWMIEDKQTAAAIDKIVSRMRDVVDELAFDERRQVLLSIRAISGDIADRLEAPSSRNH
jgi:hypothetical protein